MERQGLLYLLSLSMMPSYALSQVDRDQDWDVAHDLQLTLVVRQVGNFSAWVTPEREWGRSLYDHKRTWPVVLYIRRLVLRRNWRYGATAVSDHTGR